MLLARLLFFSVLAAASGPIADLEECVKLALASFGESIDVGALDPDCLVAGPSLIPGPLCVSELPSSQASISPDLTLSAIGPESTVPLVVTNTSSSPSSTAATVVPTSVLEPFLLRIQVNGRKRQESSVIYLEDEFSTSPRCEDGAQFRIVNGQLLRDGLVISVSDPPAPQPLLEAGRAGGISTTFFFTDRILSWSSPRFPRQTASFCLSTETVFVYFGTAPGDCIDVTLRFTPLSECPGPQSVSTTASSISPSTSGSQLSSAPISSTRPSSSTEIFSGSTESETSTSELSPTAAGTSTEASTQDVSTTTSDSLVVTITSSQTTLGTSTQLSYFEMSSYTSSSYDVPPESDSSSAVDVSSSEGSTSSITQPTQESPSSSSPTSASSSQLSSSLSVQTTQSETSTPETTSLSTASSEEPASSTSSTEASSSLPTSSISDTSSSLSGTSITSTTSSISSPSSSSSSSSSSESSTSSSSSSNTSESSTSSSSSSSSSSTSSSSTAAEPSSTPNTAGTFPAFIGAATLIAPPAGPESNVRFGFKTDTVGSLGYTGLPTGDDIGFYTTNTPASVQFCQVVGYLYHKRSGLCATAIAPVTPTTAKFTAANVQLQPCDVTGPEPPDAQAFCGTKRNDPFFGFCSVSLQFQGERTSGGPYASSSGNDALESLVFPYGSYWTYNC